MWANIFGPAAPPINTGGWGRCAGLGHDQLGLTFDEAAFVAGYVIAPERLHREHSLAHDLSPVLHGDAVVLELVLVPAEADAEHEPPAGQLIEGGDGLGRDDRLALGGQRDTRPEPDAFGRRRGRRPVR